MRRRRRHSKRSMGRASSIPASIGKSSTKSVVMASIPAAIGAVVPTVMNVIANKRGWLKTQTNDNRRYVVSAVTFGVGIALHRKAPTLALGLMAGSVAAAFLPQLTNAALQIDAQISAGTTPQQLPAGAQGTITPAPVV